MSSTGARGADAEPRRLLDRLLSERGGTYAALSRLLGRNPAYIQQYIKRGAPRRLAEADRRVIARYFGIDEALLGGDERGERGPLRRVPRLEVRASAGGGAVVLPELELGSLGFGERWLRSVAAGDPAGLSMISVEGDSMEPTLSDGDDILVNRNDGVERLRDGLYVLRMDDALLVKRLARSPLRGRITIRSDNPDYPDWANVDPAAITIIGRVVWAGRRLG